MTTQIVCARYNENINWILPLINNTIIYNKGNDDLTLFPDDKIIKLPNLGREGGTYIHHIIENYDKLSDYIIFTQGNPLDHTNSYDLIFNTFHEKKNYNFKNIGPHLVKVEKHELTNYCSGIPSLGVDYIKPINTQVIIDNLNNELSELINELKRYPVITIYELTKIITKYNVNNTKLYSLFDMSVLENIINKGYTYSSGAIFIVSKKAILKHPKVFYENIYKTLQDIHPSAGYGLEKLWKIIFDSIN